MRQADFVKQVYYLQEKVLLDFKPTDDKYQEVIVEANLVLQELQKEEDWSWLREQIVLGSLESNPGNIPEFELPEWVYKVSTLHGDCVHLHKPIPKSSVGYDQYKWLEVPYGSVGDAASHRQAIYHNGFVNTLDESLKAVVIGRILTFSRPLNFLERHMIAVTDVQRRIDLMMSRDMLGPDATDEDINNLGFQEVLCEIPDPNYVITRTAALHAQGSPPASGRALDLTDQAQKLLSAMRAHDAAATDSDVIEWDPPTYFEVI